MAFPARPEYRSGAEVPPGVPTDATAGTTAGVPLTRPEEAR